MSVIITRIEAQKKRKQRVSLFAGDRFILGVSLDTLTHFQISPGTKLTDKQLRELEHREKLVQLRDQAFRLLARRAHSRRELRDKLRQRNYEAIMIDQLLDDFSDRNYIDDAQFAKIFMEEELKLRYSGPALIRSKLLQKGILSDSIDTLLSEIYPVTLQLDNCRYLSRKKIKSWSAPPERKQILQLTGYLRSKGFSWDIIQQATADLIEENSDG
jgi:regulatory protein